MSRRAVRCWSASEKEPVNEAQILQKIGQSGLNAHLDEGDGSFFLGAKEKILAGSSSVPSR